jgi:beta-glucosidase-like glycosyl hydrolase
MGAIARRYGPGDAAVRTLLAGTDIAMLCHDWSAVAPAIDAIREAQGKGRFEDSEWHASLDRIERTCALAETPETQPPLKIIGCGEHQALAAQILTELR